MKHSNSPLIKRVLLIRDENLVKVGSPSHAAVTLDSLFWNVPPGDNRAYKFFRPTRQKIPWASVVWFGAPIFYSSMPSRYGYVHRDALLPEIIFPFPIHVLIAWNISSLSVPLARGRVNAWLKMSYSMTIIWSALKWFKTLPRLQRPDGLLSRLLFISFGLPGLPGTLKG